MNDQFELDGEIYIYHKLLSIEYRHRQIDLKATSEHFT